MRSRLEAELALETEARSRLEAEQALVQEKQTIALNLLKQGIELETIAQATELLIDQLEKLREGD
jgi:predicted transposase YdaD